MPGDDPQPLTGGARTRARILDAASQLMSSVGINRTTTKEIARAAGCSEATLYKHFRDKSEIFMRVLRERVPDFTATLAGLPARAGESTPTAQMTEVAQLALAFFRRTYPMAASLLATPELLAAHRRRLDFHAAGPHQATRLLSQYLAAEQSLGRVAADIDPDAAAALLIGACFHRAFLDLYFADEPPPGGLPLSDDREFAAETVRTLLREAAAPTTGRHG